MYVWTPKLEQSQPQISSDFHPYLKSMALTRSALTNRDEARRLGLTPFIVAFRSVRGVVTDWRSVYGVPSLLASKYPALRNFPRTPILYIRLVFSSATPRLAEPFLWVWYGMHSLFVTPDRFLLKMSTDDKLMIHYYMELFHIPKNDPMVAAWLAGLHRGDVVLQRDAIVSAVRGVPVSFVPPALHAWLSEPVAPPAEYTPFFFTRYQPSRTPRPVEHRPQTPPRVFKPIFSPAAPAAPEEPVEEPPSFSEWADEEGDEPAFNYKTATDEQIISHLANDWSNGIHLESGMLADEDLPARARKAIRRQPCNTEDTITSVDFDDNDVIVRAWHVAYGKAEMVCYSVASLYNTLIGLGNRYFTESVYLPAGFSDRDLATITKMYATSQNKSVGTGEGQIRPLRAKPVKAKTNANDELLTQQLIAQLQAEGKGGATPPTAIPVESDANSDDLLQPPDEVPAAMRGDLDDVKAAWAAQITATHAPAKRVPISREAYLSDAELEAMLRGGAFQ